MRLAARNRTPLLGIADLFVAIFLIGSLVATFWPRAVSSSDKVTWEQVAEESFTDDMKSVVLVTGMAKLSTERTATFLVFSDAIGASKILTGFRS